MAATLADIKARCLLPVPAAQAVEEADPRLALAARLLEYERYRKAAQQLGELPQSGLAFFPSALTAPSLPKPQPRVTAEMLYATWQHLCQQDQWQAHHHISREALSVRAKMMEILAILGSGTEFTDLSSLLIPHQGRAGLIVTFLALLELVRATVLAMLQSAPYAPLYVKRVE
jgi:segregation and condensation protein A